MPGLMDVSTIELILCAGAGAYMYIRATGWVVMTGETRVSRKIEIESKTKLACASA